MSTVRILLTYGADANSIKKLDGISALYIAAGAGNVDVIDVLLNPPSLNLKFALQMKQVLSQVINGNRSEL